MRKRTHARVDRKNDMTEKKYIYKTERHFTLATSVFPQPGGPYSKTPTGRDVRPK